MYPVHTFIPYFFRNHFQIYKPLPLLKCYVWNIALYGAETWALKKVEQKYLESFEMWCWRRMEKIR
jgi:hypothetical protein